MVFDNNRVPKNHNCWVSFCMKKTAAAAVIAHFSLKSRPLHGSAEKSILRSYVQVLNHFLVTFRTEDIIAKPDTVAVCFSQQTKKAPLPYLKTILMKTLRCPQMYNKYILNGTFEKCVISLKMHSMRLFWSINLHVALQKLAHEAMSLTILQEHLEESIHQTAISLAPTVIFRYQVVTRTD